MPTLRDAMIDLLLLVLIILGASLLAGCAGDRPLACPGSSDVAGHGTARASLVRDGVDLRTWDAAHC